MEQSTINAIGILSLLFWALPNDFVGWFFGLIFILLTLYNIIFGTDTMITFRTND